MDWQTHSFTRIRRSKSMCLETLTKSSRSRLQESTQHVWDEDDIPTSQVLTVAVESTKSALLAQEDTDKDGKITVDDQGPKVFSLGTTHSGCFRSRQVKGAYQLSNVLQELVLAQDANQGIARIPLSKVVEDPVDRITRRINGIFWSSLTRRLDASLIDVAAKDPKDWTVEPRSRIYVPSEQDEQYNYYSKIARDRPELNLDVQKLPKGPYTANFIRSLNDKPGVLALEMCKGESLNLPLQGCVFVVPGGRFNELYYWDSYFCCLGLLEIKQMSIVHQVIENFNFQVNNYNRILNANRSYYLGRSQPPFLTDLARRTYEQSPKQSVDEAFFHSTILCAIKEYHEVWVIEPRLDSVTGLSRYRPIGSGFPPEVELGHFDPVVGPLAEEYGMTKEDFRHAYDTGTIESSKLDEYLMHDRAVRESGHDTSYRLDNVAADLATIDLNCLLYKYETDISWAISTVFGDELDLGEYAVERGLERIQTSVMWDQKAASRKRAIDEYLWNEEKGIYFDYNTLTRKQSSYETVTCLYALWCGVASPDQAVALVSNGLPKFEELGGLSCCTEVSRGEVNEARPQRQWDFPLGWVPHQVLAWDGLLRYGFEQDARRLIYRWLRTITAVAVNFNGAIVEKYDVTKPAEAHKVHVEYGNQGLDFEGLAREGFGWTNASYTYGLTKINRSMKMALGLGVSFEHYRRAGLPL